MRMIDGHSVTKHLSAFNTMITQFLSMDIKIIKEEKCIGSLCSFPDSWDSLVVAIGINTTTLRIDDVLGSMLLEEMRRKNMEGSTHDALMVRGRLVKKVKGISSNAISKSRGRSKSRSKSPFQLTRKCWKCGKERHYKRDYNLKGIENNKGSKESQSTEVKESRDEGGDVYLDSTSTQSDHDSWLIESGVSFHMTSQNEWFM